MLHSNQTTPSAARNHSFIRPRVRPTTLLTMFAACNVPAEHTQWHDRGDGPGEARPGRHPAVIRKLSARLRDMFIVAVALAVSATPGFAQTVSFRNAAG